MNKPLRLLRALISILNPQTWGVFTETYEHTKFDAAFSISYSQGAEDISLLPLLLNDPSIIKDEDKTYIDVGAHDPNSTGAKVGEVATDIGSSILMP